MTEVIQFISHDGITTFTELVDAQQNVYNLDYTTSVILAVEAIALDGDINTEKLSIGCDATSRTSATGDLLGDEVGLVGHNVSRMTNISVAYRCTYTDPPNSASKETRHSPEMTTS